MKLTFYGFIGLLNMFCGLVMFGILLRYNEVIPTNQVVIATGAALMCWIIGLENLNIHSRKSLITTSEAVLGQGGDGDI